MRYYSTESQKGHIYTSINTNNIPISIPLSDSYSKTIKIYQDRQLPQLYYRLDVRKVYQYQESVINSMGLMVI